MSCDVEQMITGMPMQLSCFGTQLNHVYKPPAFKTTSPKNEVLSTYRTQNKI